MENVEPEVHQSSVVSADVSKTGDVSGIVTHQTVSPPTIESTAEAFPPAVTQVDSTQADETVGLTGTANAASSATGELNVDRAPGS